MELVPRRPKRTKPKATPSNAKPAPPVAVQREYAREPGLEAAIIAAPLDPVPRMVYADWLQEVGDQRGEWMALHSAIERDPKNVRLRSLAVEFLGKHHKLLLGPGGGRLLPAAWIGWRGGFVDEVRVQPFDNQRNGVASLAQLLGHPSCRFVRRVAIGELVGLQQAIDVLVDAQLPLLETVVVCDAEVSYTPIAIDRLAELATVTQLGLCNTGIATPMPLLRGLTFKLGSRCEEWVANGGCANLEKLSIDCGELESPSAWIGKMLAAVPKLRRLRLLHLKGADAIVEHLRQFDGQLEYLDLSYSTLSAAGAEQLPKLHFVAMGCNFGNTEKLAKRLESVVTSALTATNDTVDEDRSETGSWLHHMVETEGRDELVAMPGIGHPLFSIGTHHNMEGDASRATSLLDTSLTFPCASVKTWPWANAAIAHARVLELDEAELISREGLLRTPKEPNLYATIITRYAGRTATSRRSPCCRRRWRRSPRRADRVRTSVGRRPASRIVCSCSRRPGVTRKCSRWSRTTRPCWCGAPTCTRPRRCRRSRSASWTRHGRRSRRRRKINRRDFSRTRVRSSRSRPRVPVSIARSPRSRRPRLPATPSGTGSRPIRTSPSCMESPGLPRSSRVTPIRCDADFPATGGRAKPRANEDGAAISGSGLATSRHGSRSRDQVRGRAAHVRGSG